jgi:hypothetical protein
MATAAQKKATVKEILKARDDARQDLYNKASQLEARAEALKDIGYDRPLNPTELADLKRVNAAKGGLYAAENELMLITVAALDRSDEVTRFSNTVTAINKDLKGKLEDVNKVVETVKKINELIDKITQIINGLAKLAAMLA